MGSGARVLVVDDDEAMRSAVTRVLAPFYEVVQAGGAGEAESAIGAVPRLDLALVDVQLVDGDGYSVCRTIRRRSPDTEVILMTGSVSQPDEKLFRSLEEEAFYFLFKPFERRVLLALVERCLRLQAERRAKEAHARRLAEDLDRARQFQQSLIPDGPVDGYGWSVDGRFAPCDELGGDFYQALEERDDTLVVALADVVGHGVRAAMYAGMLRSTLDASRRRDPDPERFGQELLHGIDFFEDHRFATLFYARLLGDGRVRYLSAGHWPALWLRGDGTIEELPATGLVLSRNFVGRPAVAREIRLAPGDRLLVYTDGAFEVRDASDRELGLDWLRARFGELASESMTSCLDRLLDEIRGYSGDRPIDDDVTLVLAERGSGTERKSPR